MAPKPSLPDLDPRPLWRYRQYAAACLADVSCALYDEHMEPCSTLASAEYGQKVERLGRWASYHRRAAGFFLQNVPLEGVEQPLLSRIEKIARESVRLSGFSAEFARGDDGPGIFGCAHIGAAHIARVAFASYFFPRQQIDFSAMLELTVQYGLNRGQVDDIEVYWRIRDWLPDDHDRLESRVRLAAAAAWQACAFEAAHQMVMAAVQPVAATYGS